MFLGREIAQHRDYSEETARKIDAEINKLIMESYERARSVLTEHLDVLHQLAKALLEKETIMGAEMDEIIRQTRPGIELPEKPADKEELADDPEPAPSQEATAEEPAEMPPDSATHADDNEAPDEPTDTTADAPRKDRP